MAKQDVLDAINATIVENGQKGITAQSLNNILTMMTENAGEGGGSGDGLLRLNIPVFGMYQGVYEVTESTIFSQAAWDEYSSAAAAEGMSFSNLNEVVPTMLAQNTEILEQIWSKFEEGKYPVVILDDSLTHNAFIKDSILIYQEQFPEYTEEEIISMLEISFPKQSMLALPAAVKIPVAESGKGYITARAFSFSIYSEIDTDTTYATGDAIETCLDDIPGMIVTAGDMMFHHKMFLNLYFPQDGATLSSEQMSSNVYDYFDYSSGSDDSQAPLIKYFTPHLVNAEGRATAQKAPFFITADFYNKKFKYFDGLSLKEAVIADDGSVTVTTLGTISTSEGSGVVTFYMPEGETMTEAEKVKNKAAFETYVGAEDKPLVKVCNGDSDLLSIMTLFNDGTIVAMTPMGEYSITSQGDITMSVNS